MPTRLTSKNGKEITLYSITDKINFYSNVARKGSRKKDGSFYSEAYRQYARGYITSALDHSKVYYKNKEREKLQTKKTSKKENPISDDLLKEIAQRWCK